MRRGLQREKVTKTEAEGKKKIGKIRIEMEVRGEQKRTNISWH